MKIYHYSPNTGELLSTSNARRDPKETEEKYLIPAYATIIKPPNAHEGEIEVFDGATWSIQVDFRGEEYWDEDGTHYVIQDIGGTVPVDAILIPPPNINRPKWVNGEWVETEVSESIKRGGLVVSFTNRVALEEEFEKAMDFTALKDLLRKVLFEGEEV